MRKIINTLILLFALLFDSSGQQITSNDTLLWNKCNQLSIEQPIYIYWSTQQDSVTNAMFAMRTMRDIF